jgi:hypothetical protein
MNSKMTTGALLVTLALAAAARASAVLFDDSTQTFAQTEASPIPWTAALAIDGSTNGNYIGVANGWAIGDTTTPDPTNPQSAYFRFALPVDLAPNQGLQVDLYQLFNLNGNALLEHTLGAFRLSVTGDDLTTTMDVADAQANTVASSWTPLIPPKFVLTSSPPLAGTPPYSINNVTGDILVNNPGLNTAIYTVTAKPGISHVTGIRLDVLADASLPTDGPGFQPTNGNFVLNEITAAVVPVPVPAAAGLGFSMLGIFGTMAGLRKWLRKNRIA